MSEAVVGTRPATTASGSARRAPRRRDRPTLALWTMFGVVLLLGFLTYWRLPPGSTYKFDDSGASGAFSRSVLYLNYPVAIAAVALVWSRRRDRWAVVATVLSGTAFLPGVLSDHPYARWVNIPAVAGVALAAALSLAAPAGPPLRLGAARRWLLAGLATLAVPWLVAAAGFYADDVPALRHLVRSSEPTPGNPGLASVHRGLHHGLFGVQLAATAVVLSARRVPRPLEPFLALMGTYGVWIAFSDFWHEQVVKAQLVNARVPDVVQPRPSVAWGSLLAVAGLVHLLRLRARRRAGRVRRPGAERSGSAAAREVVGQPFDVVLGEVAEGHLQDTGRL